MPEEIVLSPEKKAAIARFRGEEVDTNKGKSPEEIAAEKEGADKILADQETERLRLEEEKKKQQTPTPDPAPVITDEMLFEELSKKTGKKFTSWDELKPKPEEIDKEKAAEQREANKLSYGLQQGLFNKKQFENFIADSKDPVGLVYVAELNEAKKDDPQWDDEKEKEFKDEFDEKFGLSLDPSSSKYKRGQKQISIIADTLLRQTYSPIYSLEGEYSKFESVQTQAEANKKKILEAAPVYKKDVEEVVKGLATIDFPFGEGETYSIPVSEEIRNSIQGVLMDQDFVSSKILEGYKKEEIAQLATNLVISQNYVTLAHEAAKKYREKHEKGVRGIPEGGKVDKPIDNFENLTDKQKEAINFFKPVTPTTPN
jgi:hypothetical protein